MPAQSEKQKKAAQIAIAVKKGKVKAKKGSASAGMAKSMTYKELREFANLQLPESHRD